MDQLSTSGARNRRQIAVSLARVGAGIAVLLGGLLGACGVEDASSNSAPFGAAGAAGAGPFTVGPAPAGATGGSFGAAGAPQAGATGAAGVGPSIPGAAGSGAAGSGAAGAAGSALAGTGGAGMGAAGMTAAGAGGTSPEVPVNGDLCAQWTAARANLTEAAWNGNAAACESGAMSADDQAKAHKLHSLYRTMAGLEPVEMTAEGNRLAQDCALLMAANNMISHMPSSSWTCYTMEAADTARSSSLSGGSALSSVDGYMIDPGNPTTLGHRRWILSSMLAGVGFGSTGRFSCQYQPPQRAPAGAKAWVAWPPAGEVPFQSFGSRFATVDQTGWSVQSDSIDLQSAQVTVTSDGMNLAVSVTPLSSGYGSRYALRFSPMGWTTAAGKTYHVALSGTSMPIEYDVKVVNCP